MKSFLVWTLAVFLWTGLGVDLLDDNGPRLDLRTAEAAKGGNDGGSGGGDRGKSDGRGKSDDRGKSAERGKKGGSGDDGKARKNLRAELRGLNSLGRNVNGLINSNDSKLAEFRGLFVNEDGSLKDNVELPDDETLAGMVGNYLGSEPSEDAVIDTRARLEIMAEQFADLAEKRAQDDGR